MSCAEEHRPPTIGGGMGSGGGEELGAYLGECEGV